MIKTIAVRASLVSCIAVSAHSTAGAQLRTQSPIAPPALGIGVDTIVSPAWGAPWKAPVSAIYHRWAAFLASTTPRYTLPGAALSPFWVAADQRRFISFALTLGFVSFEEIPIVVDIRPATPGQDSVFVVKTMFMAPELRATRQPIALIRVYAVRERGDWVFSNALTRTTHGWQHTTVGPFEYIYAPGYPFDRARARRAAAFADSTATAFGVPKVSNVDYYLTGNPDEMHRIIGLDWYPSSTDGGAFSSGPNRLLVSGDPTLGEDYRHEIVHVVLGPIGMGGVSSILWEGVATWLGGTLGMDASTSRKEYAKYLRAHPDVTLDSIFTQSYEKGFRPAGAVLCQMVFEHGGMPAVKALLGTGRTDDDVKAGLQRLLGAKWPQIQMEWRRKALM